MRLFSNFYFPIEIQTTTNEEFFIEEKKYEEEELKEKILKELEDELEVEYQISNYKEENKERKIVVTPSSDGINVKLIYELQEEIGKQTT